MNKLEILANALEYIEQNLTEPIKTEDVARECYCSKTALEKLFRLVNRISVHDYITRRRMTCAGRMLLEDPEKRILDVALEYGFASNESFTRTFYQVWNCNPSEFRKRCRFPELFPKYLGYVSSRNGEGQMANYKNVDISELYDLFTSRRGCYFVCGDIMNLMGLNNISRKAGDLAILEALKRFNDEAGEEDYVFRIGGDEFAMLTNSEDGNYALDIAERIKSHNGEAIEHDGQKYPIKLYASVMKLDDKSVRYSELFSGLHSTLHDAKSRGEE